MSVFGSLAILAIAVFGVTFVGALVALGIFAFMHRNPGQANENRHSTETPQPTPAVPPSTASRSSQALNPDTLAAIQGHIAKNQTLNAIRLYREATGADLAEATKAVETLRSEKVNDSLN